jgi:hypothetical protein
VFSAGCVRSCNSQDDSQSRDSRTRKNCVETVAKARDVSRFGASVPRKEMRRAAEIGPRDRGTSAGVMRGRAHHKHALPVVQHANGAHPEAPCPIPRRQRCLSVVTPRPARTAHSTRHLRRPCNQSVLVR